MRSRSGELGSRSDRGVGPPQLPRVENELRVRCQGISGGEIVSVVETLSEAVVVQSLLRAPPVSRVNGQAGASGASKTAGRPV